MQCAITPSSSSFVQVIESPTAFPVGTWTHVAVAFDGRQGILYWNGQAVAVNNSVNLLPSDIGATLCYFGKSQYSADPYFDGRLDSFKLNSLTLSAAEITAPTVTITQPFSGTVFGGGDTIAFAGAATDFSDAPLSPGAFAWSGEFHHDGLIDAAFGPLTGVTNGTFNVPTTAYFSTNVFYRINLIATNSTGYPGETTLDILPKTATVNFATVPSGLQVSLDGQLLTTPASVVSVAGLSRMLNAPAPQSLGLGSYNFVVWSDGGMPSHPVNIPTNGGTFTASFVQPTLTLGASSNNNFSLTWPDWAGGMKLYSATHLAPSADWVLVTNVPAINNSMETITLPASGGNQFYRLQWP
jgi:hypothetical protein